MAWFVFGALALAGCGGIAAPFQTASEPQGSPLGAMLHEVQFVSGEHMEWEVRYLDVLVGRVQLGVGDEGMLEGHRAVVVRSLAKSDGALAILQEGQMELFTWIDIDRGRPLWQAGSFDEIYRGRMFGIHFGSLEWPRSRWPRAKVGPQTQSSHTALGMLRGWQPDKGDRAYMVVQLREKRLRVELRAAGHEEVSSPLGRGLALRIDGVVTPLDRSGAPDATASRYPIAIWIDEGSERVPVRFELDPGIGGVVALDLVHYDPPEAVTRAVGRGGSGKADDTRRAAAEPGMLDRSPTAPTVPPDWLLE